MNVKGNLMNVKKTFDNMTPGKKVMTWAQAGLILVAFAVWGKNIGNINHSAAMVDGEVDSFRAAAAEALLKTDDTKATFVFMNRDVEVRQAAKGSCMYTAYAQHGQSWKQVEDPDAEVGVNAPLYVQDPRPTCAGAGLDKVFMFPAFGGV